MWDADDLVCPSVDAAVGPMLAIHLMACGCREFISLKLFLRESFGLLGFVVFPYIANYFSEIPILLVLSPQKQFFSSLSLAFRGWKSTDVLGKPVSALNGLKHVNIQLNFL